MAWLRGSGIGRTLARLLLWVIGGTVLGFAIGPDTVGEDWLARYPLISDLIGLLEWPAVVPFLLWALAGLGPHGDAGWVVLIYFSIAIWPLYALLLGLFVETRLKKRKATGTKQGVADGTDPVGRSGVFIKRHWLLPAAIVVMLATACGYCVSQELALARDSDFFLHRIDTTAVAEACLDFTEKQSLPQGSYPGDDPRIPKTIRDLNPKEILVYPGTVSIYRLSPRLNYSLSFGRSQIDPACHELAYVGGQRRFYRRILLLTLAAPEESSAHQ